MYNTRKTYRRKVESLKYSIKVWESLSTDQQKLILNDIENQIEQKEGHSYV